MRSRITKYICSSPTPNILSVLDPDALVRRLTSVTSPARAVSDIGHLLN